MFSFLNPAHDDKKRTFQPSSPIRPPRALNGFEGKADEQAECGFLMKLPAETRNAVYELVFTSRVEEWDGVVQVARWAAEAAIKQSQSPDTQAPNGERAQFEIQEQTGIEEREGGSMGKEYEEEVVEVAPAPAHALSLLLTCRKINQEATILAFHTHTFTKTCSIAKAPTFFSLGQSIAHLSKPQVDAIRKLAIDIEKGHPSCLRKASDFMTNAMLLFPLLTRLEVRILRLPRHVAHNDHAFTQPNPHPAREWNWKEAAVQKYVSPSWHTILTDITSGRSFAWQTTQKWEVEWPALEYPEFVLQMEYHQPEHIGSDGTEGWRLEGSLSPDHAGHLPGIELCACGCGDVTWLLAHLVQPSSGRRIEAEMVYYGDLEVEREREICALGVRLKSGVEPLPVENVLGGRGYVWDGEEAYWEGLRARRRKGLFEAWGLGWR